MTHKCHANTRTGPCPKPPRQYAEAVEYGALYYWLCDDHAYLATDLGFTRVGA